MTRSYGTEIKAEIEYFGNIATAVNIVKINNITITESKFCLSLH